MANANAGTASKFFFTTPAGANLGTDLSPYVNQVTPVYTAGELETSVIGNAEQQFISGYKGETVQLGGIWDPVLDAIMFAAVGGTALPFRFSPAGTQTGAIFHTGSAVVLEYSPPTNPQTAVTWSARLRVSGGLTRGTH